MGLPERTGQENPGKAQESKTYGNRQRKIGTAMAGSFGRSAGIEGKAGQKVAGYEAQVKIAFDSEGKHPAGVKQTWNGPEDGYTKIATPKLPARSPAESASTFHSTAKQTVKGKHGSAPAEAKQVAGRPY